MKNRFNYILHIITFFFLTSTITFAHAQIDSTNYASPDSENLMRSNGMIYVVVGVIVIILGGLILYLTSIDRKISRVEKEIRNKN